MIRPKENEIYRHFKGNLYQIVCLAEDSETGSEQVIYRALYAPYKIYSRELSMFMSEVDRKKYPDADQDYRFERMVFDDMTRKVHDNVQDKEQVVKGTCDKTETDTVYDRAEKSGISPALLRFLETEGVDAQMECLTEIKEQLTPEIMTSIEFSIGMEEAQKGDIYERYRGVKNYLALKQKYERQHR